MADEKRYIDANEVKKALDGNGSIPICGREVEGEP